MVLPYDADICSKNAKMIYLHEVFHSASFDQRASPVRRFIAFGTEDKASTGFLAPSADGPSAGHARVLWVICIFYGTIHILLKRTFGHFLDACGQFWTFIDPF